MVSVLFKIQVWLAYNVILVSSEQYSDSMFIYLMMCSLTKSSNIVMVLALHLSLAAILY